jgi:hypothetical protein
MLSPHHKPIGNSALNLNGFANFTLLSNIWGCCPKEDLFEMNAGTYGDIQKLPRVYM